MKIIKLTALILLMFTITAYPDLGDDIFFQANRDYADGLYQQAAMQYEKLLAQGTVSGNLYYNLGNAYFKLGEKGKALLNYERAKKLIGHDEDLFATIAFVNSLLSVQQPKENYVWYEKVFVKVRDFCSVEAWFFIALILFLSAIIIWSISLFQIRLRKSFNKYAIILGIFWLGAIFFFFHRQYAQQHQAWGVVIAEKTEVRYSPSYSGAVAFDLTEGMKAQVLRRDGEWTQVRLTKTTSGWMETSAIEEI